MYLSTHVTQKNTWCECVVKANRYRDFGLSMKEIDGGKSLHKHDTGIENSHCGHDE